MKNMRSKLYGTGIGVAGGLGGLLASAGCSGGGCTSCFGCVGGGVVVLAVTAYTRLKKKKNGGLNELAASNN